MKGLTVFAIWKCHLWTKSVAWRFCKKKEWGINNKSQSMGKAKVI